jgi:hypothetical protein
LTCASRLEKGKCANRAQPPSVCSPGHTRDFQKWLMEGLRMTGAWKVLRTKKQLGRFPPATNESSRVCRRMSVEVTNTTLITLCRLVGASSSNHASLAESWAVNYGNVGLQRDAAEDDRKKCYTIPRQNPCQESENQPHPFAP